MADYQVEIPESIKHQVKQIRAYISDVLFDSAAAQKRTKEIIEGMKDLELLPNRGFDADLKIGTEIYPGRKTLGLPIVDGKYIILYFVDDENHSVQIIDLIPTQSDYAKLFI